MSKKQKNENRYCPYCKCNVNIIRCMGCLFTEGITGDTNLYEIKCDFERLNKKYKIGDRYGEKE